MRISSSCFLFQPASSYGRPKDNLCQPPVEPIQCRESSSLPKFTAKQLGNLVNEIHLKLRKSNIHTVIIKGIRTRIKINQTERFLDLTIFVIVEFDFTNKPFSKIFLSNFAIDGYFSNVNPALRAVAIRK